jgi:hypothetical protein
MVEYTVIECHQQIQKQKLAIFNNRIFCILHYYMQENIELWANTTTANLPAILANNINDA